MTMASGEKTSLKTLEAVKGFHCREILQERHSKASPAIVWPWWVGLCAHHFHAREQCPSVVIIKSQLLPGVCAPTHSSYRGWLYYILHRCLCAAFCCRDNWETKYSSTHRGAYRHRVLCNSLSQRQQWLCCCTARIEPILHSNIDI